jgi:hypothetical protein
MSFRQQIRASHFIKAPIYIRALFAELLLQYRLLLLLSFTRIMSPAAYFVFYLCFWISLLNNQILSVCGEISHVSLKFVKAVDDRSGTSGRAAPLTSRQHQFGLVASLADHNAEPDEPGEVLALRNLLPYPVGSKPTPQPSDCPSHSSQTPSESPTERSNSPTESPTESSDNPTEIPTESSKYPTESPTEMSSNPTESPTEKTTYNPTEAPTETSGTPTEVPTEAPTTVRGTKRPTESPVGCFCHTPRPTSSCEARTSRPTRPRCTDDLSPTYDDRLPRHDDNDDDSSPSYDDDNEQDDDNSSQQDDNRGTHDDDYSDDNHGQNDDVDDFPVNDDYGRNDDVSATHDDENGQSDDDNGRNDDGNNGENDDDNDRNDDNNGRDDDDSGRDDDDSGLNDDADDDSSSYDDAVDDYVPGALAQGPSDDSVDDCKDDDDSLPPVNAGSNVDDDCVSNDDIVGHVGAADDTHDDDDCNVHDAVHRIKMKPRSKSRTFPLKQQKTEPAKTKNTQQKIRMRRAAVDHEFSIDNTNSLKGGRVQASRDGNRVRAAHGVPHRRRSMRSDDVEFVVPVALSDTIESKRFESIPIVFQEQGPDPASAGGRRKNDANNVADRALRAKHLRAEESRLNPLATLLSLLG